MGVHGAGRARITAVDEQGRTFIDDVGEGDLWNFPSVIPHSIQGLEDGCEFLLVFDNGSFSENETFLITDLFKHTPARRAGQELRCPRGRVWSHPDRRRARAVYLLRASSRPDSRRYCSVRRRHRAPDLQPSYDGAGADHYRRGWVRITDSTNFPAATTIAAALVNIEPGAMRELHWHPHDEWQYYISGRGRMNVFASSGKARTFNYQAGDVGAIPFAMAHYVQNLDDEPLRYLEMFRSPRFMDVSLNQWMALTPPELVSDGKESVRRLRHVDVIVGMDRYVAAEFRTGKLAPSVGDHFVDVHVELRTATSHPDVQGKHVMMLARQDFVANLNDQFVALVVEPFAAVVGNRGPLLRVA